MRFITISGFAGSGKSRLISLIIRDFSKRGLETCVVKRAEEIDIRKHEAAFIRSGADSVIIISPDTSLLVFNKRLELKDIPSLIGCDFLLLEGFKEEPLPRIVVARDEKEALELIDEWTIALTSFQRNLKAESVLFLSPEQIPKFLLDNSPYFPLWTNCGLCGHLNCVSFLRNSLSKGPSPCPAANKLRLQ